MFLNIVISGTLLALPWWPAFLFWEGVRGALAADDALKKQGEEAKFRIRETPDWKEPAAALEAEMLRRGMFFEVIDWS